MIRSYSELYNINCKILRFFTVYGPYGRPDMAVFSFVKKIINNQTINLYNFGNHSRDFTYIDDVIKGIYKTSFKEKLKEQKFNIYNIAAGKNEKLIKLVKIIEEKLGKKAKIKYKSLQLGDMKNTHANIDKIKKFYKNHKPTSIEKGIEAFLRWYEGFYK